MHGFTEHWDGFPEPCDVMNIYTFKSDVARFMLDFRRYDQAEQTNPWEDVKGGAKLYRVDGSTAG